MILRPPSLLAAVYRLGVDARNRAYDRGTARVDRLVRPVISVGNLSVGGAGKTPLVIYLARVLAERGIGADVLSRGYGRRSRGTLRVDPAAADGAARFGDEPLLIAREAGCPVFVGPSRYAAGLLAERELSGPDPVALEAHNAGLRVHLLDDGFQHRQLARDVDIVVLHRSDFSAGLLPAGRLREPLSALGRASILVLRAEDAELAADLRKRGIVAPVRLLERRVAVPTGLRCAVVFCGIARPDEFFAAFPPGVTAAARAFGDHHRYTERDVSGLVALARKSGAEALVTTEKDFVRLSEAQRDRLAEAAPLRTAPLAVRFTDERAALDHLMSLLPSRGDV